MTQLNNAFDILPGVDRGAFVELVASMKEGSKKGYYSIRGSGARAMRVTKWDWKNKAIKNWKRDGEPLVKAVVLELHKARKYRAVILADSIIAGLRKQLEDFFIPMINMDPGYRFGGKLMIDTWQWWDGIEIPKDITPVTSAHIDETSKSKLQQIQQHNQLAQRDQDAITGLVAYVEHMACARATTTKDSALNAEVAKTLNALVYVST
jgi:hypothetical protein